MIESSEFCKVLIEQTGQAFFAYNSGTSQFVYLSPGFQSIFGIQEETLDFAALLAVVHPEDQAYVSGKLTTFELANNTNSIEFRISIAGQPEQWVCFHFFLWEKNLGERLVVGRVEEVTAAKQYNDYIKKFTSKKNSILNILSHDLAAPLGMIQSLSELLAEHLGNEADEEALHILSVIEQNSKHGIRLLQEFVNQEFLESSLTEVITRRVNLAERIREAMEEYQKAHNNLMHVKVDFISASPEIYAQLDDLKFLQVINNLISNAMKFTPDGGTIAISLQEEAGEKVLVKVADTGVGIPEKYHATLFDKFTTARRPGLKGEPSIGLGMSVIKTIVEWHQGEIWFESTEGKGTVFYIRLPKG